MFVNDSDVSHKPTNQHISDYKGNSLTFIKRASTLPSLFLCWSFTYQESSDLGQKSVETESRNDLKRQPSKFIRKITIASGSKDLCPDLCPLLIVSLATPSSNSSPSNPISQIHQRCKHFDDPSLYKEDLNKDGPLLGQVELPIYLFKQNNQRNFHIKLFASIS